MILPGISVELGRYRRDVEVALQKLSDRQILSRIWAGDHTVWKPGPVGIADRLGWLRIAEAMKAQVPCLKTLLQSVQTDGYSHALLLGMGGSSLAPEVFRKSFGVRRDCLDLSVLDSTDPQAVRSCSKQHDPARTLYIVSSKSGTTVETLSFFKYCYNRVVEMLGPAAAGDHFIAITDPDSRLADLAGRLGFRRIFGNDPNIGGRYSALSFFGLVPAVLTGVDVEKLIDRALSMMADCAPDGSVADHPAALLGAVLGQLAMAGRDKVTLAPSLPVASFGDWAEQLLAESTGKEGRGILPVVGEPLGEPAVYGRDRLFVRIRLEDQSADDAALGALQKEGHPVVHLTMSDLYDLGGQFFLWELATAVAGHIMGINPFDQPNVESAKKRARQMIERYRLQGILPVAESGPADTAVVEKFLGSARSGDYISLQAYVQPTPEIDAALQSLRLRLRDRYHLATTVGYGPRFLHSTGQLHKGGADNGLFLQFITATVRDLPIPDEAGSETSSVTFGTLKAAQAMGDAQALRDSGRRVMTAQLDEDAAVQLRRLTQGLS